MNPLNDSREILERFKVKGFPALLGGCVPDWLLELMVDPDAGAEDIVAPAAADGPADATAGAGKHATSL